MTSPHPDSKWTHTICMPCFMRVTGKTEAVTMTWDPTNDIEMCCWCGRETVSGIYLRADPAALHPS